MPKSFLSLAAFLPCLVICACSSGSSSASDPATKAKATCQITQDSEDSFQIVITDPDSATITVTMAYREETFTTTHMIVFNPGVPQSVIDEECVETKAEAEDYIENNIEFDATCEENTVSMITRQATPINPIQFGLTAELADGCRQIAETGTVPEDDEN